MSIRNGDLMGIWGTSFYGIILCPFYRDGHLMTIKHMPPDGHMRDAHHMGVLNGH
jgi:hypothetical protein